MRKRRRRRKRRNYKKTAQKYKSGKWGKKEARAAVAEAVKNRKLAYTHYCDECGCYATRTEFHHYKGYREENWLKVQELCKKCHVKADKISRKIRKQLKKKYEAMESLSRRGGRQDKKKGSN